MSAISSVALSGLQVETRRLDASAHNVANQQTVGFQPLDVEAKEAPGGGAQGPLTRADPQAESRISRSILETSGTDMAREVVSQSRAVAAYRANLAALKTDDEVQRATLAIKG